MYTTGITRRLMEYLLKTVCMWSTRAAVILNQWAVRSLPNLTRLFWKTAAQLSAQKKRLQKQLKCEEPNCTHGRMMACSNASECKPGTKRPKFWTYSKTCLVQPGIELDPRALRLCYKVDVYAIKPLSLCRLFCWCGYRGCYWKTRSNLFHRCNRNCCNLLERFSNHTFR